MQNQYILGIDAGTSVVKSVAFDQEGNEIFVSRRSLPILHPGSGRSEVNMYTAWEVTAETVHEVAHSVGGENLAAIGISGTCAGVWPLDRKKKPFRNAILWNDGRAEDVISSWKSDGIYSKIFDVSGCTPLPGYTLSSLVWIAENEPEMLERIRWLLFQKDWLRYNLTGELNTDQSDISYAPGDIWTGSYSKQLFELCGLGDQWGKLPPVVRSHEIVGGVTGQVASLLGLNEGTPVVAGAVDVIAATIGGGAYRPGQALSILGTSFLNNLVIAEPCFEPRESGAQAVMPNATWLRSLLNTSGTINIDWLLETLAFPEKEAAEVSSRDIYDLVETTVTQVPTGAEGVIYLPYLNPGGINSPFSAPNARAEFFGLSQEHGREHLMRAIYEGTALAMRDCYHAFNQPIEEIVLVGGGARSDFWAQMLADAVESRIVTTQGTEVGARGVAILAGIGTRIFASYDEAISKMVHEAKAFEMREDESHIYREIYELYRHLYLRAREAWDLRSSMLSKIPGSTKA